MKILLVFFMIFNIFLDKIDEEKYFKTSDTYILIDISDQVLYYYEKGLLERVYPISSSKYGIGSLNDSKKTPLGKHYLVEKIGEDLPKGTILKARENTNVISEIYTENYNSPEDFVTSRILWLKGCEPFINKGFYFDSYRRYIYIHGTQEEGLIGKPASDGCIRMKNNDVIELFDLIDGNILVYINN